MALGIKLMEYGHRVRLASHAVYRDIVLECNLEFYPLGGDPKVLSEYIVKNRGIIPSSAKDAVANYKQVEAVVMSTYAACTEPDPEGDGRAFMAQAIISNPPCYGHIHCAEKLQVPLHMMFTMPWSPTKAFPQPLARLNPVADGQMAGIRNQLSYVVINELVHDGLLPIIQRFRKKALNLPPLRLGDRGAHSLSVHKIPFAYCWSPAVVPKPLDWFGNIDVVGYYFLNESARNPYTPPDDLKQFLDAGSPPVYIGFGSLVVDDPKGLAETILEAAARVKDAGQRILLSKGWGKLGEGFDVPDNVLLLDAVPHDWLLPLCSAVVHHGGAGTTAAGLMAGNPTTVVPFFGDQSFWGGACARLGVGPAPIAIDDLTTDKLVDALEFMRRPEAIEAAKRIAVEIKKEDGVAMGVEAFHRHLPVEDMMAGRPTGLRLSEPGLTDVFSETGTGVIGFFTHPYKDAKKKGPVGAVTGLAKGVGGLGWHPIKGMYLSGQAIHNDTCRGVSHVHDHYVIRSRSLDDKEKQKLRERKGLKEKEGSKTDASGDDQSQAGSSPRTSLGDDPKRKPSGLVSRLSNLMHSSSRKESQPLGDQENAASEAEDDEGIDKPSKLMDFSSKRFNFRVKRVPLFSNP
ncbi:hypothetical protein WJX73_003179 [Symbiochloris irregularis]|uniref:Uncharacterized protein n=1 Tax=Symbiochloris irregularis TaxID=706552 RepID=A0AAW1NUC4_9CHLO